MDTDKILEELGGISRESYEELVSFFFEQAAGQARDIRKALENHDSAQAACLVHSLKGAAANLRLTRVQDAAVALENRVRQEQGACPPDALQGLESSMDSTRREIFG